MRLKNRLARLTSSCCVRLYTAGLVASEVEDVVWLHAQGSFCCLLIPYLRPLSVSVDTEPHTLFTNVFVKVNIHCVHNIPIKSERTTHLIRKQKCCECF